MTAGLQKLIDDLDAARADGTIYTYGQIQERLRALIEPVGRDEREALDYAIRVPVSESRVEYRPLHKLISTIQNSVLAAGFRLPADVTDAEVEAAAQALTGLSDRLWGDARALGDAHLTYYYDAARSALEAARAVIQ